jgi:hypothetical protein
MRCGPNAPSAARCLGGLRRQHVMQAGDPQTQRIKAGRPA